MRFEWDPQKEIENKRKHGVTFSEAKALFLLGKSYLEIFDTDHSNIEDRFIAIGPIDRGIVYVVWTERVDDIIRIIGARFATKREQKLFGETYGEKQ